MSRMEIIEDIIRNRQAQMIDHYLVDVQTAHLLMAYHRAGNANTKRAMETYPLDIIVAAAWKLASKHA